MVHKYVRKHRSTLCSFGLIIRWTVIRHDGKRSGAGTTAVRAHREKQYYVHSIHSRSDLILFIYFFSLKYTLNTIKL